MFFKKQSVTLYYCIWSVHKTFACLKCSLWNQSDYVKKLELYNEDSNFTTEN